MRISVNDYFTGSVTNYSFRQLRLEAMGLHAQLMADPYVKWILAQYISSPYNSKVLQLDKSNPNSPENRVPERRAKIFDSIHLLQFSLWFWSSFVQTFEALHLFQSQQTCSVRLR